MKKKPIKKKIIEYISRPASRNEVFMLLLLILIGKWFAPYMVVMSTFVGIGAMGAEVSDEKFMEVSQNLADGLISPMKAMYDLGYKLKDSFSGNIVIWGVKALPWISAVWVFFVLLCALRIVSSFIVESIQKRVINIGQQEIFEMIKNSGQEWWSTREVAEACKMGRAAATNCLRKMWKWGDLEREKGAKIANGTTPYIYRIKEGK